MKRPSRKIPQNPQASKNFSPITQLRFGFSKNALGTLFTLTARTENMEWCKTCTTQLTDVVEDEALFYCEFMKVAIEGLLDSWKRDHLTSSWVGGKPLGAP